MQVVSMTEARNNFKAVFDSVYLDNEEVIIHRKGRENVVVIPFAEYNSIKETNYLLSNKNNARHLIESIEQLHQGKYQERELVECD
ncbi:MAG: type II toxin-antitoxin system prevent-host-death family antitoxin [Helicobacteraceae bacterium]|nr:type II toxin-antitoxin system prevent-host-death family antitoxin [Helicobacteraceae bacterium]